MTEPTIEQRMSALRQGQPNPFLCGSGTAAQQAPRVRNGLFSDNDPFARGRSQQTQQQSPRRSDSLIERIWCTTHPNESGPITMDEMRNAVEGNPRKHVESRVVEPRMLNA